MRNDYAEFTGTVALVLGRFSPLHAGHKKLIRTALKRFGKVQIGIRNTPIDEKNPFSIEERIAMIYKEFEKEIIEKKITWVVLDDIAHIIRGRKVGWNVVDIELDKYTESVSGTKIRKEMKEKGKLNYEFKRLT